MTPMFRKFEQIPSFGVLARDAISLLATFLGAIVTSYSAVVRLDSLSFIAMPHHARGDLDLITVFISASYQDKDWCGLEWRALRDLIKQQRADEIMLLRFDDTALPGLFSGDGDVRISDRPAEEIAGLILERLQSTLGARPAPVATDPPDMSTDDEHNPFDPWISALPPTFVGRGEILKELERTGLNGGGISLVGE